MKKDPNELNDLAPHQREKVETLSKLWEEKENAQVKKSRF